MTFYGKGTALSEVIICSQGRISIPQGTVEKLSTRFAKYKTRILLEFVVMAMVNKKTRQRVVVSIGKIGIEFHLSHSFLFRLA